MYIQAHSSQNNAQRNVTFATLLPSGVTMEIGFTVQVTGHCDRGLTFYATKLGARWQGGTAETPQETRMHENKPDL